VPEDVKHSRLLELQALQRDIQLERHRGMVGETHRVLVEGASRRDARVLFGRNLAADRLVFPGDPALAGTFVDVEITRATALTLSGRLAGHDAEPELVDADAVGA